MPVECEGGVSLQLILEGSLVPKSLPKVTGSRTRRFQRLSPGSLLGRTGEPLAGEGSAPGAAGAHARMHVLSFHISEALNSGVRCVFTPVCPPQCRPPQHREHTPRPPGKFPSVPVPPKPQPVPVDPCCPFQTWWTCNQQGAVPHVASLPPRSRSAAAVTGVLPVGSVPAGSVPAGSVTVCEQARLHFSVTGPSVPV